MQIDLNTKLIGRFHKEASPRGLNIYNPFFQENGINAVYLLFHHPDPTVLIEGFRALNLTGAITAGFELDEKLPTLLDSIDDSAKFIGRIGYITNDDGKVTGHYQGGKGILRTIKKVSKLEGQHVVIVGAGNVAKGLLFEIEKEKINCSISIYNRTIGKAEKLKDRFSFVENVQSFTKIQSAEGDVFVNLTDIGGSVKDISFSKDLVARFSEVVDVTYEVEKTPLIDMAISLNKTVATGWDMFTFQGQACLEGLLNTDINADILRKYVVAGLSETVK